jgi:hypothetical protein
VSSLSPNDKICAALFAMFVAAGASAAGSSGVPWASLTAAQQQVLAPLQKDWTSIDPTRRQKWLEVAHKFDGMPADERERVQQRMADWARLTPAERTQARLQFQEVRQLPAQERTAKWQAYQALPEAERRTLAQRAQPPSKAVTSAEATVTPRPSATEPVSAKRVAPAASGPASRTTPHIVVQVKPGATTTTMSTRAAPTKQQTPGAPKIAATASYVDPATLLPKRGTSDAPVGVGETSPQQ